MVIVVLMSDEEFATHFAVLTSKGRSGGGWVGGWVGKDGPISSPRKFFASVLSGGLIV